MQCHYISVLHKINFSNFDQVYRKNINIFNAENYQDIFHGGFNETNLMFYMSVHFSRTWSKLKTFGMEGVDLTTLVFT